MSKAKLRVIPLGGCGEIGKNMTVFEYGSEAIILDAGIMFPMNDMHGVDYIIPDFNHLRQRTDLKIHGILFTHGHEDHIGAVRHVVEAFPDVPLYATRLTAGLIEVKLREARLGREAKINVFRAGETFRLGTFKIEAFHMCHSIPDCVGFAIDTPAGLVVHSGDYKFDNMPLDGHKPDYARLAEYGRRGVRLLMADSTNADRPGWTPSESTIEPAFDTVFKQASGRIIIATFASLISRIQLAAKMALRYNRRLAIVGPTMREYVKLAREIGYLDIPEPLLLDPAKMNDVEPHKLVIMVTGSQGEPTAVLTKLARGEQRTMDIIPGDTILLSSHPIPGNEELVYRTINKLYGRGANVVYDSLSRVHVSGHCSQEEMRLLISLTKPDYLMPVHGELRHLIQHGKLGVECGIPQSNIVIAENGTVVEVDRHHVRKGERIPGGWVFVDGSGVGDIGPAVIRDREILARDGFVVIAVTVDKKTGKPISEAEVISRGFVYVREAEELIESVKAAVYDTLKHTQSENGKRRELVEQTVGRLLYNETKRRPMVFSILSEV
ncbi:MAG: ribonuclease J [Anaerolineae bacterium]|nr:ribonuclease J [Anaerolineae bacterium]MDW8173557.1 ribonuclease J [Anaerolineae bacterium]